MHEIFSEDKWQLHEAVAVKVAHGFSMKKDWQNIMLEGEDSNGLRKIK